MLRKHKNRMKLATCFRIFAALLSFKTVVAESRLATGQVFNVCPKGWIYPSSQELEKMTTRSGLDCVSRCMNNPDCNSVNIYPGDLTAADDCQLLGDASRGCGEISMKPCYDCYHAMKDFLICHNGGVSNGTHCACPVQYGGKTCHRLIRDCEEMFTKDVPPITGIYQVQPPSASTPFEVKCKFSANLAMIHALERTTSVSSFNKTWAEMRDGFGHFQPNGYFIGLENLRKLLMQARYTLNIFLSQGPANSTKGSVFYKNVELGPESSSYELSYTSSWSHPNPEKEAGDGFISDTPPFLFATPDHDTDYGCARASGYPGWYGKNCSVFNLFADGTPKWPYKDSEIGDVKYFVFAFTRQFGFFDEM